MSLDPITTIKPQLRPGTLAWAKFHPPRLVIIIEIYEEPAQTLTVYGHESEHFPAYFYYTVYDAHSMSCWDLDVRDVKPIPGFGYIT